MAIKKGEYLDIIDDIKHTIGDDWNSPRSQLYIAARIENLQRALDKLEGALSFEKAVAERVSETFLQSFRYLREEKKSGY